MKNMKKMFLGGLIVSLALSSLVVAVHANTDAPKRKTPKPTEDVFVIYTERGSRLNHYIPSGWMGDYGDLKFNQGWKDGVAKKFGKDDKRPSSPDLKDETCIQIKYSGERKQGAGWAGIYWQSPANNWGDKRGGYDLSNYSKLTFWAKGTTGDEIVDKFLIGGNYRPNRRWRL
jgi:hypothetical protein